MKIRGSWAEIYLHAGQNDYMQIILVEAIITNETQLQLKFFFL